MFGLSQLYQMRGRVGRSDVAAYTYLLYPPGHELSNEAKRRLKAMRELSHLGSGFELANRDLEIRGAGNIFGTDQVKLVFMCRKVRAGSLPSLLSLPLYSPNPGLEGKSCFVMSVEALVVCASLSMGGRVGFSGHYRCWAPS